MPSWARQTAWTPHATASRASSKARSRRFWEIHQPGKARINDASSAFASKSRPPYLSSRNTASLTTPHSNAIIRVVRELLDDQLQPERTAGGGGRAMRRLSRDVRSPGREESSDKQGEVISHLPMRGQRGRIRVIRRRRTWSTASSPPLARTGCGSQTRPGSRAARACSGSRRSGMWSLAGSLAGRPPTGVTPT